MKKYYIIAAIILCVPLLSSCTSQENINLDKITDPYNVVLLPQAQTSEINIVDSIKIYTDGNIYLSKKESGFDNVKVLLSADGWIYYLNLEDKRLYRVNNKGLLNEKILDVNVMDLQYATVKSPALHYDKLTNYLYVLNSENSYRIKLEGNFPSEQLLENGEKIIYVDTSWIYYTENAKDLSNGNNNTLYRKDIYTGKVQKLVANLDKSFIDKNYIVYTSVTDNSIYRCDIDGKNPVKINMPSLEGGYKYSIESLEDDNYIIVSKHPIEHETVKTIYRIDRKLYKAELLTANNECQFYQGVYESAIYYVDQEDRLISVNKKKEKSEVLPLVYKNVQFSGGYLYYSLDFFDNSGTVLFRHNMKTGERQKVFTNINNY